MVRISFCASVQSLQVPKKSLCWSGQCSVVHRSSMRLYVGIDTIGICFKGQCHSILFLGPPTLPSVFSSSVLRYGSRKDVISTKMRTGAALIGLHRSVLNDRAAYKIRPSRPQQGGSSNFHPPTSVEARR